VPREASRKPAIQLATVTISRKNPRTKPKPAETINNAMMQ
jgi:hypothetical protein